MLKKIALLGLTAALGLALVVPAFAANPIQLSVGNVPTQFNTDATGTVAVRVFSISGADTGINNNTLTCLNQRCVRTYTTLGGFAPPGGYPGNTEGTGAYNTDADNQTFYAVWDGQVNAGAGNHAGFYAAQGTIASSTTLPSGDFRKAGCVGTLAGNCFARADSTNSDQTPVLNVNSGYQNAHSLASQGGFSPIPTVRVAAPGGTCPAGQSRLTWDEPELYTATMNTNTAQPPPASPVRGVRLYSNNAPCSLNGGQGPSGDVAAGWVAGPVFAVGAGATGTCVPVAGDTWYALTVRFRGPGNNASSEIESGIVGGTGFVGANSQCVGNPATASRIVNLNARYAGRGSVNVTWTTGTEGGVQGFYVTRGTSAAGPFERVSELVAPRGDGQTYTVQNKVHAALGRVQYYSIEVVNSDGTSTQSGPTAVSLPAAKQRFGR